MSVNELIQVITTIANVQIQMPETFKYTAIADIPVITTTATIAIDTDDN
jgi:hypothetical protein